MYKFLLFFIFMFFLISCGKDNTIDTDKCVNSNCKDWQICEPTTGNCILKSNSCEKQEDCLLGYACDEVNHECKMANECFTNSDCASDDKPICENGICIAKPIVVDKCAELACEDWQICNLNTNTCDLKYNRCEKQDDCLAGYACDEVNHECKMANECFVNNDCTDSEKPVCKNGICVELFPTEYCSDDYDCSANSRYKTCIEGKCAIDDCTQDGYECAYNTNNRYFCNENNKCEEPTKIRDMVKAMVLNIMYKLNETHYQNTGYVADVNGGELKLDCSYYVKQVIKRVSREHYEELPHNSSSLKTALAKDYYNLFKSIKDGKYHSKLWKVITDITQARAGDIIAYAYGDDHAGDTTGHVMVIMSTPVLSTCVSGGTQYWVWVSDSARSGHASDTRNGDNTFTSNRNLPDFDYEALEGTSGKPSGVGIGKMWFRLGNNSFYRWSLCNGTKHEVPILIGRMIKKTE